MVAQYRLLRRASFARTAITGLRLASVLLASMSLVYWWRSIGLFREAGTAAADPVGRRRDFVWPSCWSMIVGRLGNDSLAALLVAAATYCTLEHGRSVIGIFGLSSLWRSRSVFGLLTKAFFLPLTAGMLLWLLAKLRMEALPTRHPARNPHSLPGCRAGKSSSAQYS